MACPAFFRHEWQQNRRTSHENGKKRTLLLQDSFFFDAFSPSLPRIMTEA